MSLHEEEIKEPVECANCGVSQNLLKCSRCHTVYFCGVKCQKAYWPFHKTNCKRNEFADAIEESEPKFARWMRSYGKMAVLKDDEVDRLERAAAATSGTSRSDVMESMYGRLEPKPKSPTYTPEEKKEMRQRLEQEAHQARLAAIQGESYAAIELPCELGMECHGYKWRQNQSHVEIFIPLPAGTTLKHINITLTTTTIHVAVQERPIIKGKLYKEIKAEESTWFVQDGVLEIIMLKRNRKGHYEAGTTNADTYWRSVVQGAPETERLALDFPPTSYYWCANDDETEKKPAPRRLQQKPREAVVQSIEA